MDKMIHLSLNTLDIALRKQAVSAQNLANMNVAGYRGDMYESFGSLYMSMDNTLNARTFAITNGSGIFDPAQGRLRHTDMSTDMSIVGEGFFVSKKPGLGVSLTRRGDMSVSAEGQLVNGAGALVLNQNLQPINVPPFRKMIVSEGGELLIEPLNGEPGVTENLGLIGLVSGDAQEFQKDEDGEIRPVNGEILPDQNVKIKQGYIEESNVNAIDELVASMGYQRSYELNLKLIKTASELDENTASLLRLPNG